MKLEYHHSMLGNVLLLLLGVLFLFFGLDFLLFHTINISSQPPSFVCGIILFLGVMTFSGALINLIKRKNVVISANENNVTIYTGAVGDGNKKLEIDWENLFSIEVARMRPTFQKNHAGHLTKVLVFKFLENSVKWPKVMLTKNRISFSREDGYDQIIIDAWLSANKKQIAKELIELGRQHNSNIKEC